MIVNFKIHEINRDTCKVIQIPIIKIYIYIYIYIKREKGVDLHMIRVSNVAKALTSFCMQMIITWRRIATKVGVIL